MNFIGFTDSILDHSQQSLRFYAALVGCECYFRMKTIPLTKGYVAIVDDEDFERLSKWNWIADERILAGGRKKVYAYRHGYGRNGGKHYMHRDILGVDGKGDSRSCPVDHINNDGLDNQRCNLRICTIGENIHRQNIPRGRTSKYRGISPVKNKGTWQVVLRYRGIQMKMGEYADPKNAAACYDAVAQFLYGEYAVINGV